MRPGLFLCSCGYAASRAGPETDIEKAVLRYSSWVQDFPGAQESRFGVRSRIGFAARGLLRGASKDLDRKPMGVKDAFGRETVRG